MDIDLDLPTSFDPLDIFQQAIRASMIKDGHLVKHPVGVYFQNIAKDKITNLAAIPYETAEDLGYFKIDFLHLNILNHFQNKDEIRALLKKEPNWTLLEREEVVQKLFQLHKHAKLVTQIKPRSVQELSDCIAIVRPSKKQLLHLYLKDREKVRPLLYRQGDDDKSAFKRGHSISYALTIVLQLHLIEAGIL